MKQLTGDVTYNCIKRTGETSNEHGVLLKEHAMDIYVSVCPTKESGVDSLDAGEFYASVVCNEELLEELVIGRLVCDGMIKSLEEVKSLKVSGDHSVADVEIVQKELLNFHEEDSCEHLQITYPNEWIFAMADVMAAGMPLHEKTWSVHSCYLFRKGELLFCCEDISRHNAVDKVIGYAVKNRIELSQCALYTSGRVPADMIDKVIVAGIPVLVSKGMPTMQAVELAREAEVTLICGARRDQMRIYTDYRKK